MDEEEYMKVFREIRKARQEGTFLLKKRIGKLVN